ncbi:MAG: YvcK family protein [Anaerolineae bacterium]|nr:YvcK family protein [Anaerolineae bacterium]
MHYSHDQLNAAADDGVDMKKFWTLLLPGMHIKRWLLLLLVGIIFVALGVAYIQVQLYRTYQVPNVFYYLTLQFIPRLYRAFLFGVLGLALVVVSFIKLGERLFRPLMTEEENILDAVYRHYVPVRRSKVVILAGTSGLAMLMRIRREVPWDVVGVVPPANAGASFARLHADIGTTADEVLIPTLDTVQVCAELQDGVVLKGEATIARPKTSPIRRVFLVSESSGEPSTDFRATQQVIKALQEADAIVIGPGSLFTNLVPALLIKEINETIRRSNARKIFVCNLMTQPHLTSGYSVADHVRAIQTHCGFRLDYVLAHRGDGISEEVLERYLGEKARPVEPEWVVTDDSQIVLFADTPQQVVMIEGAILLEHNLADERLEEDERSGEHKVMVRHDPARLSAAILALLEDYALQRQLSVSRSIFREYDVRGVVGVDLSAGAMEMMGRAFGTYVQRRTGRKRVSIGYDARETSISFQEATIKGLVASGCDVIDLGLVPTPLVSFSVNQLFVDGAVQVTASHNPAEFNGLKLQVGADPVAGEELQHVERLIANRAFITGKGRVSETDMVTPYRHCLQQKVHLSRPLQVVIDAGNGVNGPLAVQVIQDLGCTVVPLYCEPDGTFPNHPSDPAEAENLRDLVAKVKEVGADVGIAFDGDGDRIGIVDEQGTIVPADQYLLLFVREALRGGPAKVVFEVRCSEALFDGVVKFGGIPVMSKCGNTAILPRMRQERAILGGELSGHIFFDDHPIDFDDALFAAARLLEYVAVSDQPLSEMLKETWSGLPHYVSSPELRIPCPDFRKAEIVDKMRQTFIEKYRVIDIDGARIYFDEHSWALIRASNTQPRLSIRFEAQTEKQLAAIKSQVKRELARYLPDVEF